MNQMLIVKDWNYLATHLKKLATHKCVATPWLRTTDLQQQQQQQQQLLLQLATTPTTTISNTITTTTTIIENYCNISDLRVIIFFSSSWK